VTDANLVPMTRRQARRVRRSIRAWSLAGGGYAGVLALALAIGAALVDSDAAPLERRLTEARAAADAARAERDRLSAQAEAARRRLEAARAVSRQPDWSILLAMLPACLGEDAALRRVTLKRDAAPPAPGGGKDAPPPAPAARGYTLQLAGAARSQSAPNSIVLALEQTGIFDRVKLVETRREASGASDLVAFDIECVLAREVRP
jgi:Tfp pilus assembly protein PilN